MIWLALLIPLIAIVFLAFKFPKKICLLEYIILFAIPLACIITGKFASVYTQTKDIEYWNSYATQAWYEEEWKERWTEMETYTVTVGSGKNRRTETRTRMVTKYRTNPEKWYIFDNIGEKHSINKPKFEQLCKLWKMKQFKDMERSKNTSHTITKDGDAYYSLYDKNFTNMISVCKKHSYKNKVQCSRSVFNFEEINDEIKKKYKLFEFPIHKGIFGFNPILGHNNKNASERLQKYNAKYGASKQLHMMLLIFKNQPLEAGVFQESYWKGGNKNEFIVCVGTDGDNIKWVKVISWTEEEELKARVTREVKELNEFGVMRIVEYMGKVIPLSYRRKEFEDFNYLSVRPTNKALLIIYMITFITTIGICIISVMNNADLGSTIRKFKRRRRSRYSRFYR